MFKRQVLCGILVSLLSASPAWAQDSDPGAEYLLPFKVELFQALSAGMAEGPDQALLVCAEEAEVIALRHQVPGISMGRTSDKLRNSANAPADWMRPLLESFASGALDSPVDIDIGAGHRGYVEPIYVQELCLTCHGSDVAPGLAARLDELYPVDAARGYSAGDFRGLFWVEYEVDPLPGD